MICTLFLAETSLTLSHSVQGPKFATYPQPYMSTQAQYQNHGNIYQQSLAHYRTAPISQLDDSRPSSQGSVDTNEQASTYSPNLPTSQYVYSRPASQGSVDNNQQAATHFPNVPTSQYVYSQDEDESAASNLSNFSSEK